VDIADDAHIFYYFFESRGNPKVKLEEKWRVGGADPAV
jgi:hypothetical protein